MAAGAIGGNDWARTLGRLGCAIPGRIGLDSDSRFGWVGVLETNGSIESVVRLWSGQRCVVVQAGPAAQTSC